MFRFLDNWLSKLLVSVCTVFAPIEAVLATVCFLVFADLLLGIWAAKKRGEQITSSGLRRTIIKLAIYEVAVAFAFLCEQYLTGKILPLCSIVSSFIGLTELLSILESLNEIGGGNLFNRLIDKIKKGDE